MFVPTPWQGWPGNDNTAKFTQKEKEDTEKGFAQYEKCT